MKNIYTVPAKIVLSDERKPSRAKSKVAESWISTITRPSNSFYGTELDKV